MRDIEVILNGHLQSLTAPQFASRSFANCYKTKIRYHRWEKGACFMKALIARLLMLMIMLNGGLDSALAAKGFDAGQQNLNSVTGKAKDRKASEEAYRNDFNPPQSEMRGVIERFVADRGNLARFYTIPYSATRQERFKQFYGEWLATIGKLNFDAFGEDGKIDYILFKNYLDHELRQLEIQAKAFAEIEPLLPFAPTIMNLEEARKRMEKMDSAKVAGTLNRLNRQIAELQRGVEAGLKADPSR